MEGDGRCRLNRAGLSSRPTGVFVAAGNTDTAVVPSLIPNRISYALDVKGQVNIMKLPVPQL